MYRKLKSCRLICVAIVMILLAGCDEADVSYNGGHRVVIDSATVSRMIRIPLDKKKQYTEQSEYIRENTLNDTCKIGIVAVPPGKTGKLYLADFYGGLDTLAYPYVPYKATSGKLVYDHYVN